MKYIKCVVAGDTISDKTRLLINYCTRSPPLEYVPTIFDNYSKNIMYEDTVVNL